MDFNICSCINIFRNKTTFNSFSSQACIPGVFQIVLSFRYSVNWKDCKYSTRNFSVKFEKFLSNLGFPFVLPFFLYMIIHLSFECFVYIYSILYYFLSSLCVSLFFQECFNLFSPDPSLSTSFQNNLVFVLNNYQINHKCIYIVYVV